MTKPIYYNPVEITSSFIYVHADQFILVTCTISGRRAKATFAKLCRSTLNAGHIVYMINMNYLPRLELWFAIQLREGLLGICRSGPISGIAYTALVWVVMDCVAIPPNKVEHRLVSVVEKLD